MPKNLYMFIHFCTHIRPIRDYTLLPPYTTYACLHTSTVIDILIYIPLPLYTYTCLHYFYAHIRPIHDYILLRPHTYVSLQHSRTIYLYMLHNSSATIGYVFIQFYGNIPIRVYILLHQNPPDSCLYTSTLIYLFLFI